MDGVFSKPEPVPIHIDTDENDPEIHHLHSEGLSSDLAAELLKKFGRNELPEKKTPKWKIVSAFLLFSFFSAFLLSPGCAYLLGCLLETKCAALVLAPLSSCPVTI